MKQSPVRLIGRDGVIFKETGLGYEAEEDPFYLLIHLLRFIRVVPEESVI